MKQFINFANKVEYFYSFAYIFINILNMLHIEKAMRESVQFLSVYVVWFCTIVVYIGI
jgi:hypothetical protein